MTEEEIYQHIKQTQLTGKDLKKKIEMKRKKDMERLQERQEKAMYVASKFLISIFK